MIRRNFITTAIRLSSFHGEATFTVDDAGREIAIACLGSGNTLEALAYEAAGQKAITCKGTVRKVSPDNRVTLRLTEPPVGTGY